MRLDSLGELRENLGGQYRWSGWGTHEHKGVVHQNHELLYTVQDAFSQGIFQFLSVHKFG